jgi:hypothetical protein
MDSITFERGQGCNAGNAANLDGISHDWPWLGASVWSGPARWRPRRGRRRVLNYGRCERGRGPSLACCFVVVVVPVLEWRGSRCGEGLGCRDRWKGGLAARNLTLKLPERGWVGCAVCARPSAVRACLPRWPGVRCRRRWCVWASLGGSLSCTVHGERQRLGAGWVRRTQLPLHNSRHFSSTG